MPIQIRCFPERIYVGWRGLLHQWAYLMDKYCNIDKKDAPYWYTEMTLTGLLAAAAWQLPEGWGLIQWTARRSADGNEENNEKGVGWVDAWIGHGKTWYTIESKLTPIYSPPNLPDEAIKKMLCDLAKSQKQLASLDKLDRGKRALAICYGVPDLSSRLAKPQNVQSFFDVIATHFGKKRMLTAIYRPPGRKGLREYKEGQKPKRYCPGVILVGELFPNM